MNLSGVHSEEYVRFITDLLFPTVFTIAPVMFTWGPYDVRYRALSYTPWIPIVFTLESKSSVNPCVFTDYRVMLFTEEQGVLATDPRHVHYRALTCSLSSPDMFTTES